MNVEHEMVGCSRISELLRYYQCDHHANESFYDISSTAATTIHHNRLLIIIYVFFLLLFCFIFIDNHLASSDDLSFHIMLSCCDISNENEKMRDIRFVLHFISLLTAEKEIDLNFSFKQKQAAVDRFRLNLKSKRFNWR